MTRARTDAMMRVDQAGEYGATRIYAGQLAVMGDRAPHARRSRARWPRRKHAHLARVRCADRTARRAADRCCSRCGRSRAIALGAATALIGPEAAMACTAAIEEEIDRHYTRQLERSRQGGDDPELGRMIGEFRDDERAHRDVGARRRGRARAGLSAAVGGDPARLPRGDPRCRNGSDAGFSTALVRDQILAAGASAMI